MVKMACIQLNSTDDVQENIATASVMIREAAAQGAKLLALPENAFLMATGERFHAQLFSRAAHPAVQAMQTLAKDLGVWLLLGTVICKEEGAEKATNTSFLIDANGAVSATYDKIHLFDVELPSGEKHYESHRMAHGCKAVVAPTPFGALGLSVCYDVRFPHLYRALAKAGAEILCTPAAFTRFTGEKGGWHVLNRARAMENGCFVLAPAQCGEHAGASGRKTYGHSLIIDPWGTVIAEAGDKPDIIYADIDISEVAKTRQTMPSLRHDRVFEL